MKGVSKPSTGGLLSAWQSMPSSRRRFLLVAVVCLFIELILRFEGVDDVHFFNVPIKGLQYIHFFERCYPPDQDERLEVLMKGVRRFHEAAERNNLRYWIDYGTLLGCVRDGAPIPWDYDADFGVLKAEIATKPAVLEEMRAHGYEVEETDGCRYFIWIDRSRHLKIEIFMQIIRSSDNFVIRCGIHDTFRYHFPARYIERTVLKTCLPSGPVRLPQDAWSMLKAWRYPSAGYVTMPNKFWCFFTSFRFLVMLLAFLAAVFLPLCGCIYICCTRL